MVVCKFFLQGNCRFGDNCRNEHPRSGGSGFGGGSSGSNSNNRFGALSNSSNQGVPKDQQWTIEAPQVETIRADLGKERPKWVLSTYGAVKNTPGSLFEGNEYSSEEIRLRFYEQAANGQEAQADQEASQLWSKAETDMTNALNHANDIRKFMQDCEKKHPNRYDFLKFDGTRTRDEHAKAVEAGQSSGTASAFGSNNNAFGQPSSSSASSNPFSKPAAATFGQPSGPSAFGGNNNNNPFSKPAQSSAFGQAGFGAASNTNNAFAQPSAASAFGGKPAFGATAFGQSAFGQTAQPAQQTQQASSAFGQPSQPSAFGASPFGGTKNSTFGNNAQGSAFGQPAQQQTTSAFGQPSQSTSAFGQPSQPTSAFGQPSQPTSAFGQAAFGQPAQPASAFGQPSQPASAFGQAAFGQTSKPSAFGQTAFGQIAQPSTTSAFGNAATTNTAFGAAAQQSSNPFGAKDPVNAVPEVSMDSDAPAPATAPQATQVNPFGSAQAPTSAPANPFGARPADAQQPSATTNTSTLLPTQPALAGASLTGASAVKSSTSLVYTQTLPKGPTQTNIANQLSTYRGQPVRYLDDTSSATPEGTTIPCYNRPDGKGAEKIWYPEGSSAAEIVSLNRPEKLGDIQGSADKYTDDVKKAYQYLFENGKFEAGKMPLVPPMREWVAYDF